MANDLLHGIKASSNQQTQPAAIPADKAANDKTPGNKAAN
jgi:hypothetical protein